MVRVWHGPAARKAPPGRGNHGCGAPWSHWPDSPHGAQRARSGSPPRRHTRTAVEPVRPNARGPRRRLVPRAQLDLTARTSDDLLGLAGPVSCGDVGYRRCVAPGSAGLGSSDARGGRLARLGASRRSGQQSERPDRPGIWFRGSWPVPRGSTTGGRGSAGVRTRSARPGLPGGW
jgi:hypothetical protein